MAYLVLPEKYYLAHFFELIDFLEAHSGFLMEDAAKDFLRDFRSLSEDAQCAYVRMVNRKGHVFHRDEFLKYSEIGNAEKALDELEANGFLSVLRAENRPELLECLTKTELQKWMTLSGLKFVKSRSREELRAEALEQLEDLPLEHLPEASRRVVQGRVEELSYLLFLYFGRIQKSLNLYTLRDLGIRGTNQKAQFRPRFASLEEARAEYFFLKQADCLPVLETEEEFLALLETYRSYPSMTFAARGVRDQILLALAEEAEALSEDLSLRILSECERPPARERKIRLLWKLERATEAREVLESIFLDPGSDEELLFAEDFLARKFEKKKLGSLTETLRQAPEITLSDAYFRKPEWGVCEYYRERGYQAHFTENELFTGLFGLLFWDELFESEQAAIFNPFERSPADLVGPGFYEKHQTRIEEKLAGLSDPRKTEFQILKTVTAHYGELNDIFQWKASLAPRVTQFLKFCGQGKDLALVLRTMARKFEQYHSGFPDLMVEKDGEIRFVEVKAEGDALRSKQLSKFRLLREAGFEVDVLKVRWEADPSQVYVVVDVETTGGSSQFHRVTEIGAVKIQNGVVIDEFQTLINPGRSIPAAITRITGITNEMVADAPYFQEIAERFMEFVGNAIFVAHNARFDYGFIQREFQRLEMTFVRPQMCTVSGMRKAFPGLASYSLKNLTEHFEISLETHHRALCDARAAGELLLLMNSRRTKIADQRQ